MNWTPEGADLRYDLRIEFEKAAFPERDHNQSSPDGTLLYCHGNGPNLVRPSKDLSNCGGSGQVHSVQNTMF